MKGATKKFSKYIIIVFCVLVSIMWLSFLSMFCLIVNSCKEGGWHDTVHEKFLSEISLECDNQAHDSERWRFGYKLPFISYQYYFAHYIDDGSMTEDELEMLVKDIASVADEKVGGHKTEISIEHDYDDFEEAYVYSIVFKKRCRTLFWV